MQNVVKILVTFTDWPPYFLSNIQELSFLVPPCLNHQETQNPKDKVANLSVTVNSKMSTKCKQILVMTLELFLYKELIRSLGQLWLNERNNICSGPNFSLLLQFSHVSPVTFVLGHPPGCVLSPDCWYNVRLQTKILVSPYYCSKIKHFWKSPWHLQQRIWALKN